MTATAPPAANRYQHRQHIALHLAHRWFAFLEAPDGDLAAHLTMFSPKVRLTGHRGSHRFAHDHESLTAWFASIPDAISSHHIVHSSYSDADVGYGLLSMVVAYQAPASQGMHGSIISYETSVEFSPAGARFVALDKTPILSNTSLAYETSWSANRVLARVHAELGGISRANSGLRAMLGTHARQVHAQCAAPEGSSHYQAIVTVLDGEPGVARAVRLEISDDGEAPMPVIDRLVQLAPT